MFDNFIKVLKRELKKDEREGVAKIQKQGSQHTVYVRFSQTARPVEIRICESRECAETLLKEFYPNVELTFARIFDENDLLDECESAAQAL